jgi:hypothetical protein
MKTSSSSTVASTTRPGRPWEYRSRPGPGALPWIHVCIGGPSEGRCRLGVARGVIALGDVAIGVVAVGGVALGLFAVGGVALGLAALAGVSLGVTAVGGLAIGVTSLGAVAAGVSAHGAMTWATGHVDAFDVSQHGSLSRG